MSFNKGYAERRIENKAVSNLNQNRTIQKKNVLDAKIKKMSFDVIAKWVFACTPYVTFSYFCPIFTVFFKISIFWSGF